MVLLLMLVFWFLNPLRAAQAAVHPDAALLRLGSLGGAVRGLHVADDRAYVVIADRLVAFDISRSDKITCIGVSDAIADEASEPVALAVEEQWVYVGVGQRLLVVNAVDPRQMRLAGTVEFDQRIADVAFRAATAYVALGPGGMRIISMADVGNPRVIASVANIGVVERVALTDFGVLAAEGPRHFPSTLTAIETTTPGSPHVLGSLSIAPTVVDLAVSGRIACVATMGDVYVIDLSEPTSLQSMGPVDDTGSSYAVVTSGTYAYVAGGVRGLVIVDIADAVRPARVAEVAANMRHSDLIGMSGETTFLMDRSPGAWLWSVDVSLPTLPEVLGDYLMPGPADHLAVESGRAYVLDSDYLRVIDIGDPYRPLEVAVYRIPDFISEVADISVAGGIVYVAAGFDGLLTLDAQDLAAPSAFTAFPVQGHLDHVVAAGGWVFAFVDYDGLHVYDVSGPGGPSQVCHVPLVTATGGVPLADVSDVAFFNNVLYVVDATSSRLWAVDAHDPAVATVAGYVSLRGGIRHVSVDDRAAYVATAEGGLSTIDISDLGRMHEIGSTRLEGDDDTVGLAAIGSLVILAKGASGLLALDTSELQHPTLVGAVTAPTSITDVVAWDRLALFTDRSVLLTSVEVIPNRGPLQHVVYLPSCSVDRSAEVTSESGNPVARGAVARGTCNRLLPIAGLEPTVSSQCDPDLEAGPPQAPATTSRLTSRPETRTSSNGHTQRRRRELVHGHSTP